VPLALRALREIKVIRGFKARLEHKVLQGPLEPRVLKATRDFKDTKAIRAQPAHKVAKATRV